ncbi:hypothetical protein [Nitrosomonas sp.]|uniref:hypothetical protein n=1 Tax=Nitrosomonas sp. TaxID=42353 RepID=UPI0025EA2F5D|nr:hypothetical protein [Nitrosomonas sp.]
MMAGRYQRGTANSAAVKTGVTTKIPAQITGGGGVKSPRLVPLGGHSGPIFGRRWSLYSGVPGLHSGLPFFNFRVVLGVR